MEQSSGEKREEKPGSGLLFLFFVFAFGTLAWIFPEPFAQGRGTIPWLLGAAMLGMGLTLTPGDFRRVLERPAPVGIGIFLQYTVMPLAAVLVSKLFGLPPEAALGVVLVGACPDGTASNVLSYLARADVALAVTLTTCSTLIAPLVTPWLTYLLAGQSLDVPVAGMFVEVIKMVVAPVLAGIFLRRLFPEAVDRLLPALPVFTGLVIALIIAVIVGAARPRLGMDALPLIPAVALHNVFGLVAGYYGAKLFGRDERVARTIAIEVGVQNSGLAVALASKFFSPLAALPGALFSVWQNVCGALLAAWWGRKGKPPPALPR